jgi:hypothetical protein
MCLYCAVTNILDAVLSLRDLVFATARTVSKFAATALH